MIYNTLAENLLDIKKATETKKLTTGLSIVNSLGMNEGSGTDGGFMLEKEHSNALLGRILTKSVFAQRCLRLNVDVKESNQFIAPLISEASRASGARHGGVESMWVAENNSLPVGKVNFTQLSAKLKKASAVVRASSELAKDAEGFEFYISSTVAQELAFVLDHAILRGNGVNELLGVLSAPSLITVEPGVGQGSGTITLDNVLEMLSRLDARSYSAAEWFCNIDCLKQLCGMTQLVGTSGATVVTVGDYSTGSGFRLAGLPVNVTEYNSSCGAVGDLVLADFSQYLLRIQPMQTVSSIHVYYLSDDNAFRFILRVAGLPLLSAPITPMYAATGITCSNFVALASRV